MADARHTRDQLNQSAQKVYDQLVDQRDRIAAVDPNAANKLYGPHSDLTADEGMVLMAQELAESGITDIYKVKKENVVDKIPIKFGRYITYSSGEGDEYATGYYYDNPKTGEPVPVNPNTVKDFKPVGSVFDPTMEVQGGEGVEYGGYRQTPPSGYIESPRTQYVNTETGEPLKIDQYGQYAGQENILQSRGAADRVKIGYGLDFVNGTPTYFQTAYKEPSSWKSFTNSIMSNPLLPVIAALIPGGGPVAAALTSGAQAAYGPGDLSDALKAAALSFGTSMALDASGIKGLLGGAAPEFDITDVVPGFTLGDPTAAFGGMPDPAFGDPSLGDPTAGYGGMPDLGYNPNIPAGEAGIQQILSEAAGAPTPDVVYPELGADYYPEGSAPPDMLPEAPKLPEIPTTSPEWDTGYPSTSQVPEGSLGMDPTLGDPTAAPGGMPTEVAPQPEFDITDVVPPDADPTLGDPTAAPGGMPPLSVGDQLAIAGMTAGATLADFAATPLGRLALSLGGSALLNKVFEEEQGGGAGTAGWSGSIPEYQMVRERVPFTDTGRRPGEYGRRYFSDTSFVPITPGVENAEANLGLIQQAQQAAQAQAAGLASLPPGLAERRAASTSTAPSMLSDALRQNPGLSSLFKPGASAGLPSGVAPSTTSLDDFFRNVHKLPPVGSTSPGFTQEPSTNGSIYDILRAINTPPQVRPIDAPEANMAPVDSNVEAEPYPVSAAQGGLMGLAKGRYLDGPTDGMEDRLKATIEDKQPARLSHGEFVIPADVVSHLGNGNSQAGAKRLYDMMDKIRMARTGTKKQGKQINPSKYLPS